MFHYIQEPLKFLQYSAWGLLKDLKNDPDVKVWFDFREGKTDSGLGGPPGKIGIKIETAADNGHKLWTGKMNALVALTMKKLKITGPMGNLLKLQPLLKKFSVTYNETLKEMGREDIIL